MSAVNRGSEPERGELTTDASAAELRQVEGGAVRIPIYRIDRLLKLQRDFFRWEHLRMPPVPGRRPILDF